MAPEPRNASDTDLQLLGVNPDSRLGFVAVLVDDNQSHTTGIVSIVRALPGEALRIIQPFADQLTGEPAALTAQRWRRGGLLAWKPSEAPPDLVGHAVSGHQDHARSQDLTALVGDDWNYPDYQFLIVRTRLLGRAHSSPGRYFDARTRGAISSPPAESACSVPDPASRAPITASIDSLTNRLRERSQFNFQATQNAIKADPVPFETGHVSGRRGSPAPVPLRLAELISLTGSVRLREEVARGKGAMRPQSVRAMITEPVHPTPAW